MANPSITNPLNAYSPQGVQLTPQDLDTWGLDPGLTIATLTSLIPTHLATNITAPLAGVGAVVELQSWNGSTSGGTGSPTHPTIALSATTADAQLLGVITGTTVADAGVTVVGEAVQVKRFGIAKIIVDNTCTVGHVLVQSTGTAGAAHDSGGVTGTAGQNIGTVLEAVTVSSGLGMTYALIKLT